MSYNVINFNINASKFDEKFTNKSKLKTLALFFKNSFTKIANIDDNIAIISSLISTCLPYLHSLKLDLS